jgi:hypothetical protein
VNDPPANRPVIALRTKITAALSPEDPATFHRYVPVRADLDVDGELICDWRSGDVR